MSRMAASTSPGLVHQQLPRGLCLHDHGDHTVRDRAVQIASDAGAFGGYRESCALIAFCCQSRRRLGEVGVEEQLRAPHAVPLPRRRCPSPGLRRVRLPRPVCTTASTAGSRRPQRQSHRRPGARLPRGDGEQRDGQAVEAGDGRAVQRGEACRSTRRRARRRPRGTAAGSARRQPAATAIAATAAALRSQGPRRAELVATSISITTSQKATIIALATPVEIHRDGRMARRRDVTVAPLRRVDGVERNLRSDAVPTVGSAGPREDHRRRR